MSDVAYPSNERGYVVTETDLDTPGHDIVGGSPEVWECTRCGRLAIEGRGAAAGVFRYYSPDDGKYGKVLEWPWADAGAKAE